MINFLKRFLLYFVVIFILNILFLILFNLSAFWQDPFAVFMDEFYNSLFFPLVLGFYFALSPINKTWAVDKKFFNKHEIEIRNKIATFPFDQKYKDEYRVDMKKEFLLNGKIKIERQENIINIIGPSHYINLLTEEFAQQQV